MWEGEKTTSLPRTRKDFTVTSSNGQIFFVKPGKAFLLTDGNFVKSRFVSKLNGKIARSVVSPCGSSSLHLPKSSPYLSFHKNRVSAKEKNGQKNESSIVVTIPLPGNSGLAVSDSSTNAYLPTGDSVLITEPIQKLSGKSTPSLSDHVQGIAISEDCNVIAISIDQEFWIWQQYPEETKGIGYWTDLTSNHQFSTNAHITSPVNSKHITHGYMKPSQPFTLHPSIGPAIPQGCAITYQDVCLFSNADEGCGVCCLTAYLPPCMPFNELNIFVSVCKFKGQTPTYERSSVQLPIVEGEGNPCAWWSIDCKFLVIAVSQSLVILTRYLRVVKVIPLTKIFPGDSPTVASVAWSSNGEFFIITSIQGNIMGYDCGEFVPKELLDFEEFIIPEKQIPKMEIQNNEIFNEEEEIKEQTNSGISNNEIIEEEEEEEIKEKVPKKKIKKTKETKKKYVKPKEKVKNKTKIRIKPKSEVKPNLRLLTVDPPKVAPQTFNFTPHIPQPQAYVQLPIQIPMFYPQEQTQTNNKSLWDITPDDFPVRDNLNENNNDEKVEEKEKEIEVVEEKLPESIKKKNVPDKKVKKEIKPEKPILQVQKLASFSEDDKPVKEEKEKSVKNRVPVVIVSRKTEKPKIDEMSLSFSSELSELSLQEPRKRVRPPVNPFPLDDMLYKRVGHLLDEVKASPEAPDLPDVPKFVPPPVYDIPNVDKYRHKDSSDSYAPSSFQSRSSHQSINTKIKRDNTETHRPFEQKVGNEIPQPDWKPNVVPLRNPIILGTNEIKRKNDKPQNAYLQLKEIEPTKKK
ncbi:hypothetical protein GPJ56_001614 [Histomonas meleagridis]|uniref:uncharacterized protein n=1 Tax=Histomonas meleagridis TaxID=135588 RepID=UPI0035593CB9|nr:hypothetical protein GPJ56_001614 [Histomonas meleagridis]KAH0807120.1 hypothetical protein GO595_000296 [Histomonas meleagridis]